MASVDLDRLTNQAVATGDVAYLRDLAARGTNVKARDRFFRTALIRAACGGINSVEVVKCLIELGADIDAQTAKRMTALMEAAMADRRDVVRVLLEHGADPTLRDKDGHTARYYARGTCATLLDEAVKKWGKRSASRR
jgi:hypothetical protein